MRLKIWKMTNKQMELVLICNEIFDFLEKSQYNELRINIGEMGFMINLRKDKRKGSELREIGRRYYINFSFDLDISEIKIALLDSKKEVIYQRITYSGMLAIAY